MKGALAVIIIMILCFSSFILPLNLSVNATDSSLIGYWSFDEGSGTTAFDSSGNGNTGTLGGPQWVTGISGSALRFDGVNDYVSVPTSSIVAVQGNAISLAAWIKPGITLDNSLNHIVSIIDKGDEYTFQINPNDGRIWFAVILQPGLNWQGIATTTTSWSQSTWYHIVGTYDGNTLRIYVNGILQNSKPLSGSLHSPTSFPLTIGAHSSGYDLNFEGVIDDVKIHNYAMTDQQIKSDFEKLIFEDNFDNYSTGSFPSSGGWELIYNGAGNSYQAVTSGVSNSLPNSLELLGQNGWSADVQRRFSSDSSILGYEVYMRAESNTGSADNVASVGFWNLGAAAWGKRFAVVYFDETGIIYTAPIHLGPVSMNLGPYNANQWYKVQVIVDRSTQTYSVWINESPKATDVPIADTNQIEALFLASGHAGVKAYFDDVKIIKTGNFPVVPTPTPTQPPVLTHTLTVTSAHGSPNPSLGQKVYTSGTSITATVNSQVTEGNTIWRCIGWTGYGSVESSGTSTTTTFILTQESGITWVWTSSTSPPSPTSTNKVTPKPTDSVLPTPVASLIVTAEAGHGGIISLPGTHIASPGETWKFTINPNSGYEISDVKDNGVSKGPLSTYTVSNIHENHEIQATFFPIQVMVPWDITKNQYDIPGFSGSNYGSTWSPNGHCWGLSTTEFLYYTHYSLNNFYYPSYPLQNPSASSTHDLILPTIACDANGNPFANQLNNPSLAVYFHHVWDPDQKYCYERWDTDISNEQIQFDYLLGNLTQGNPVMLGLRDSAGNSHAVIAYGVEPANNGNCFIYISDPNYDYEQTGIFNLATGVFTYDNYVNFAVYIPKMIDNSWLPYIRQYGFQSPQKNLLSRSIVDYYLVVADKKATVTCGNMVDYFTSLIDSQTFVCGIPGSCGFEEGTIQVYAIPKSYGPPSVDPGSKESNVYISLVSNQSGTLTGYGYLFNAKAINGELNYTITPSANGLILSTSNTALTANVTFVSSTETDSRVFQSSSIPIDAQRIANFSFIDWETLNTTTPLTLQVSDINQPSQVTISTLTNMAQSENASDQKSIIIPVEALYTIAIVAVVTIVAFVIVILKSKSVIAKKKP